MSYFKDIDYKGLSNPTKNKHKLTKIFSKDTFLCKNFLSKGKLPDVEIKQFQIVIMCKVKGTLNISIDLGIAIGILFVLALLFMNLSEFLKETDDENSEEAATFTAAVVEIEVETSDLCKHVTNIFG